MAPEGNWIQNIDKRISFLVTHCVCFAFIFISCERSQFQIIWFVFLLVLRFFSYQEVIFSFFPCLSSSKSFNFLFIAFDFLCLLLHPMRILVNISIPNLSLSFSLNAGGKRIKSNHSLTHHQCARTQVDHRFHRRRRFSFPFSDSGTAQNLWARLGNSRICRFAETTKFSTGFLWEKSGKKKFLILRLERGSTHTHKHTLARKLLLILYKKEPRTNLI